MPAKNQLRTVRFSAGESRLVGNYLKENQLFESFSSLARVATLSFIGQGHLFQTKPVKAEKKRLPFLWDYDLSEVQIREILAQPGLPDQKRWLIERILSQARFEEVKKFLTLEAIGKALPRLRLPQKIRERWTYALNLWK